MIKTTILSKFWPYLLIFALSFLTALPLFHQGYFTHQDDLQVMRIFEMRKCLIDVQIPCRWVPDMGFGNGYPLFNFYGVPPYYLGALLSFVIGYVGAAKALFILPLMLGGFTMYILGKELFGKIAGLVAAILYIFAPYRALDIYVRGDVAESFAIALIPLIFYFYLRLISNRSLRNLIGGSISLGLFLTTHNVMSLIFMPVLILWILYWLWRKKFNGWKAVFISLILGFGLSAFFILPAFFEKNLVQVESLKTSTFDFRAHYTTLYQLFFDRFWGYGPSVWEANDGLSFQIGWPHWWLTIVSIPVAFILSLRKKKQEIVILLIFLLFLFFLSVFMTHNKSSFIWEKIEIIQFAQFPWRFLSITIFAASVLGGGLVFMLRPSYQYLALWVVLSLTMLLNLPFFAVDKYYQITDQEKLSGYELEKQQYAGILDYLPKTATEPKEAAPQDPIVLSGKAEVENFDKRSNAFTFKVRVQENTSIEIPVFDFPVWKIKIDDQEFTHSRTEYMGRIKINLPKGNYLVKGYFTNTPIRSFANLITVISVALLLAIACLKPRINSR